MSEPTSYAPGTPSWVDLSSPDPDESAAFYGKLFGWDASEPGPVETTGGYRMFERDGKPLAGLAPIMQEGQPPVWTTYVSVASAEDTAAKVVESGGQQLFAPMDVMDAGRMAVFADPNGAVFSVWQPGTMPGAGIVNDPVSLTWNELMTRDPERAKAFYGDVFGWGVEKSTDGPPPYWMWTLDGREVGGMIEMNDHWPPEAPPSWGVYFAVDDCDATVKDAKGLGGSLVIGPMDVSAGRFATLVDPHGAFFSVIAQNNS